MTRCTVGVMAYNEEQTIRAVLYALLSQRTHACEIVEIVVVASGCTDRTVERANEVARDHPLITVDVQAERAGKAAAINRLIAVARGDVIVLVGADTLPDPDALEHLVRPFARAGVGMTGARVVPLNDPRTFIGFTVQVLWHVHHRMALRWPKLGELVAFRNVIAALPENTATDEVALEALISAQGYRLVYTPEAIVYNYGPETLDDFLLQRRRIFAGHLHIAAVYNYVAASLPIRNLLMLASSSVERYPSLLPLLVGSMLLECWGRALGAIDTLLQHRHHIWKPAASTKKLGRKRTSLTLITLYCSADSVNPAQLMRAVRHVPDAAGTLLWWDYYNSAMLLLLPQDEIPGVSLEEYIRLLMQRISPHISVVSYRVVRFNDSTAVVQGTADHPVRQERRAHPAEEGLASPISI